MTYMIVSSKKLRSLCEKKLENLQAYREMAVKKHIAEAQQRVNNRWWNRLLGRKFTLEQIEQVEEHDIYIIRNIRYGWAERVAKDLLKMCKYGPRVNVSVEDFMTVTRIFKI